MTWKMKLALALLAAVGVMACGAATPGTAVGSPQPIDQLKFAVMDAAGKPAFCDPDFYPIARLGGEQANAIARYPEIQADAEVYMAIVAHEHLPSGQLTDPEKLIAYRDWKVLRALTLAQSGNQYSFSYRALKTGPSYAMVTGTVRVDGVVTITSSTSTGAPNCPICLAATTLIGTPSGEVPVTEVTPGTVVWTEAPDGRRVPARVIEVGSTPVPAGHLMVRLTLADGRALLASPGHRAADGRPLGTLAPGDELDGSTIVSWQLVPYAADRTYDLLPAGPTGTYWANGILLSSTLAS
jgi:hypothetical protein